MQRKTDGSGCVKIVHMWNNYEYNDTTTCGITMNVEETKGQDIKQKNMMYIQQ